MTVTTHPHDDSTATCVFAVCRDSPSVPVLEGVQGHADAGDSPVRMLRVGTLSAVVQSVPAAAFSEEAMRRKFSDAAELERCARAHHAVVCAAARCAPTVPLPLATLYFGDERARSAVGEREAEFRATLDRVAGRVEWGVKVWSAPERTVPQEAPAARTFADVGVATAGSSGRAYLDRVRGRQQQREARQDAALRAAEQVDASARRVTVAARRLRLHDAGASGEQHGSQLLNAAYLVAEGRGQELAAAVERLRRDPDLGRRVRLEVTGPWVPYSFLDGAETDDVRVH